MSCWPVCRALLRRARPAEAEQLQFADLTLDTLTRDVRRAGSIA